MSSTPTSITIHRPSPSRNLTPSGQLIPSSALPQLLKTPAGLALLEIQGTINLPPTSDSISSSSSTPIGRFEFPDYNPHDPSLSEDGQGKWMKKVFLYIGSHQRMTGEVKKLSKPLGVLRRRSASSGEPMDLGSGDGNGAVFAGEELEIAEVIRWKLVFSLRPEPVGVATEL